MPVESAREVVVRQFAEEDGPALAEMYSSFRPLGAAQGLPPINPERRKAWLLKLRCGVNLVAFLEGKLAGHLALVPIGDAAELTCFVHQDFRRRGVATALTLEAVEEAARGIPSHLGLHRHAQCRRPPGTAEIRFPSRLGRPSGRAV